MPFGLLTSEMRTVLAEHVRGRTVHDLGAGDLVRACELSELGAESVLAFDKMDRRSVRELPGNVLSFRMSFEQILTETDLRPIDIAFVAWPANWRLPGLLELLERSRTICYLGINDEFTACGWPDLFSYLSTREVLSEVNHPRNDLLVYGKVLEHRRQLRPEERRGLSAPTAWSFQLLSKELGLDEGS